MCSVDQRPSGKGPNPQSMPLSAMHPRILQRDRPWQTALRRWAEIRLARIRVLQGRSGCSASDNSSCQLQPHGVCPRTLARQASYQLGKGAARDRQRIELPQPSEQVERCALERGNHLPRCIIALGRDVAPCAKRGSCPGWSLTSYCLSSPASRQSYARLL